MVVVLDACPGVLLFYRSWPRDSQNPGPLVDSRDFDPVDRIWVTKDIEARGGTGGVSLSEVTQCFSAVPEPTSMALLGVGMAGLIAFRRLFRRNPVV
jgi:PEP-CTERM motif